jgi:transposase-like protein
MLTLCIGDGPLGFCTAADQIFAGIRLQCCWAHKTVNALNKLPRLQLNAKQALHEIGMTETINGVETAFDLFVTT